jgi:hypothetical protein
LKENGKFSVVVSNENKVIIQNECDGLDGSKKYVGKYEMEYRKKVHDEVHIIFMNGERFSVPVTKQTTIKDIKIYLGKLQQREPRYYRLLLNSIELKVSSLFLPLFINLHYFFFLIIIFSSLYYIEYH